MLTETERAYLAGFFDGEGCINISKRKGKDVATVSHYLQVILSQGDYDFLLHWHDRLNMGSVHEDRAKKKIPMRRPLWHWRLYDRQAEALLGLLLPYLDIKKREAKIAIQFMTTKGDASCHATPAATIRLREHYKEMLHEAKRGKVNVPSEVATYEQMLDSQLCLFQADNI